MPIPEQPGSDARQAGKPDLRETLDSVEMPTSTAAPMVLALGVCLLAAGIVFGIAMIIVGAVVLSIGLGLWIAELLPGRGHFHEEFVPPTERPKPIVARSGAVEQMHEGVPGYRVQLPVMVHPVSAGVKGGLLGGAVMPVPALLWGLISHHGIWYPVNLLAGMVLPGLAEMSIADAENFHLSLLIAAMFIHVAMSLVAGLLYGVLLPTLPFVPKPMAWSGLLMPVLWTGFSFLGILVVSPILRKELDWPSFIFSQFVFGLVVAIMVMRLRRLPHFLAGAIAGVAGGVLMPIPAAIWGWATQHGIWYPANLLAAMVLPGLAKLPTAELQQYHAHWLATALVIHGITSLVFGTLFGILLPRLPVIPGPMSWGALLMPVLWTAASFSLMGVVNPILRERVDWPWYIASQFVFGIAASIVVVRSEQIRVPPAGRGPDTARIGESIPPSPQR
ncbi:MAG TPA: hypothetical protein VHX65_02455 [Pirellulales bacterium]|nr:hypothetical protein [Pirellulales bacterium]